MRLVVGLTWVVAAIAGLSACAAVPGIKAPDTGARGTYRLSGKPGIGSIFMSGSGDEPPQLLQRFRDLAGGVKARIYVAPFAGGLPNANDYVELFKAQGCTNVHLLGPDIADADGVYVVGGQTGPATENVAPYHADLRALWRKGAVIGGHSAGAMLWGEQLVVKGEARAAMTRGAWAEGGGLDIRPGIGLVPGTVIDPHFGERGRLPRLWVAAGATGLLGIGVDEDTAGIWDGTGKLTVVGAGTVTLVKREGEGDRDAARMTVLGDGNTVDLVDWGVPRPE